jgi:heptosyltransferase-2
VLPFVAPWTAFQGKYRLWKWPWREMIALRRQLARMRFDVGLSARWDPRDHFLLRAVAVKKRLGFPRMYSQAFLTDPLEKPDPRGHRYEYWRVLGRALNLSLPTREEIPLPRSQPGRKVLVHTGAGQPIRVWPLERFQKIVAWLRARNHGVLLACDPDQRDWWLRAGEAEVATPRTVNELLALVDQAGVFIGNDSGPGHLAAFCGMPTFSLFGPQLPEWFSPLHPEAVCLEGKPCPFKPCSDYCRFPLPRCLREITDEEVCDQLTGFLDKHLAATRNPVRSRPIPGE